MIVAQIFNLPYLPISQSAGRWTGARRAGRLKTCDRQSATLRYETGQIRALKSPATGLGTGLGVHFELTVSQALFRADL